MDEKSVFNATICIIGIAILLIHTVNILLKKDRRKDEESLLLFIVFTVFHFSAYLTFTFLKNIYTSDPLIIGFYTAFYIMNNVEAFLLFLYAITHLTIKKKIVNIITIANLIIFITYVAFDIINIFTRFFFTSVDGVYVRSGTMIASQGYQFIALAIVFVVTIFDKALKPTEKIAFGLYCSLPLVAIIIQNALPGYAVAYLSIILSIEILFLFVNVNKNVQLANEAKKTKEAEIKMMMSQIQPHFIYNTLASISTLIKIDPEKAQNGLDAFTEYLRINLSSLSDTGLIPFNNELKHIKTYLDLEKMRFDDRLNIIYDITVSDFIVPPLSIQPLVENAVKHGILKKIEGGTVTIKTEENKDAYIVKIIDDGVGFNPEEIQKDDGSTHIGLNNVKYRLTTMCNGDMKIESEIDKGTTITMLFYK